MADLAATPVEALAILREHLKPATASDSPALAPLIRQLASDSFNERQKAASELRQFGPLAMAALKRAYQEPVSLEHQQRIDALLVELAGTPWGPDNVRIARALLLLQWLDRPEARDLIQALAEGHPDAWLTQQARGR